MPIEKYKEWMKESTMPEKKALAAEAKTSLALLYQLAAGHRKASSELAGRIAKGVRSVRHGTGEVPLPVVLRGDISEVCGTCPYFKDCEK